MGGDGPDFAFERRARRRGACRIAGLDEVGRGPLAGPVVAAAVILDPARVPRGLDDSKRLPEAARERLFAFLRRHAAVGIGAASVAEIDLLDIRQATHLAMRRAVARLPAPPDHLLVDGNDLPAGLPCPAEAVIGGDGRVRSIAAASIVAKVVRDRLMARLARRWPGYGWEHNRGYATAGHLQALARLGATPHHRRSFAPIHKILCQGARTTP